MSSGNEKESAFPEHSFVATCLQFGLEMNDLKEWTYVDIMKMLISFLPKNQGSEGIRQATQSDIDKLLM